MKRLAIFILMITAVACGNSSNGDTEEEESGTFNYESFSKRFTAASLPYQLSDTGFLKNEDTAALRNAQFQSLIADSIKQKLVGKTTGVKFVPLAKVEEKDGESYFIIKAVSGNKKAAMLTVFNKDKTYGASFPFLIPDSKKDTYQNSVIDKSFSITRGVSSRDDEDVVIEGKDVYVYNADAKDFILIMTDLLDDSDRELINPIDTFASAHKFSGDYTNGSNNLVSIRDGRTENEPSFFIHFEKKDGCKGEIKGTLLMTSSTTAVYREGGNPCVLEFKFSGNKVTLKEVGGCGTYRDLKCTFDATYTRKKVSSEEDKTSKKTKK